MFGPKNNTCCSNLTIQSSEDQLRFNGSYNQLRDNPSFGTPDYYEIIHFFPDKSLTLTAESNNLISGLNLETSGHHSVRSERTDLFARRCRC